MHDAAAPQVAEVHKILVVAVVAVQVLLRGERVESAFLDCKFDLCPSNLSINDYFTKVFHLRDSLFILLSCFLGIAYPRLENIIRIRLKKKVYILERLSKRGFEQFAVKTA